MAILGNFWNLLPLVAWAAFQMVNRNLGPILGKELQVLSMREKFTSSLEACPTPRAQIDDMKIAPVLSHTSQFPASVKTLVPRALILRIREGGCLGTLFRAA